MEMSVIKRTLMTIVVFAYELLVGSRFLCAQVRALSNELVRHLWPKTSVQRTLFALSTYLLRPLLKRTAGNSLFLRFYSRLYRTHQSVIGVEIFNKTLLQSIKTFRLPKERDQKTSNPHQLDASIRFAATKMFEQISAATKLPLYYIQKKFTVDNSQHGSSLIYDPVDLKTDEDEMPDECILTLIDVDYYLDMDQVLMQGKPAILYTLVPTKAKELDAQHCYHFEGNEVVYKANGGYESKQELWNYGADFLRVGGGFMEDTVWYKIKRMSLPGSRQVIFLMPETRLPWWLCAFSFLAKRHKLCRHKFVHTTEEEKWTYFEFWDTTGLMATVASQTYDSYSVTLKASDLAVLVDLYSSHGGDTLPMHNLNAVTGLKNAFLLMRFVPRLYHEHFKPDLLYRGVGDYVIIPKDKECPCDAHVQCAKTLNRGDNIAYFKQDAQVRPQKELKCGLTVVAEDPMVPDTNPSCSPSRSEKEKLEAYKGRVEQPQKQAAARVNPRVLDYVEPFIAALNKRGVLPVTRLTWEQVQTRLPKKNLPTTEVGKIKLLTAQKSLIKQFIKSEAYTEHKDPRLISPLDPIVQSKFYAFTYALQDALHSQKWFAFGSNPKDLAKRIKELSQRAILSKKMIAETDFSRYDGTITSVLREVERRLYAAAFNNDPELMSLHEHTYNQQTKVGTHVFETLFSRLSGSPDTCLMNSLLNIFSIYVAIGDDAFDTSIIGGDDGITIVDKKQCEEIQTAASDCGFKLKCTTKQIGEPFSFLSRFFNWDSENSCCDVRRAIPKMHIVNHVTNGHHDAEYHKAKLESILTDDGNTPIISDIARDQIKQYKNVKARYLDSWRNHCYKDNSSWPNVREQWMVDLCSKYFELVKIDGKLKASPKN